MSVLVLLIAAIIWGTAFVAQYLGMDHLGPFAFNSIRYFIGALVLLPVIYLINRKTGELNDKSVRINTIKGGICCGLALTVASLFQQFGIIGTTVGKAGFITALYVVLVPVVGMFFHKKVGLQIWLSVLLAIVGFYMMCLTSIEGFNMYDGLVLVAALVFSFHILTIDHFAPKSSPVAMSIMQFFVSGVLCGIGALIFERPGVSDIVLCAGPLLYAGVLSCGVAYTLQIVGQRGMNPAVATLLLSLESVFSAIAGWIVLGHAMSIKEMIGAALVFAGVIAAQVEIKKA